MNALVGVHHNKYSITINFEIYWKSVAPENTEETAIALDINTQSCYNEYYHVLKKKQTVNSKTNN